MCVYHFFFFKQNTAYEMRISDWSSDVCSSDLAAVDATKAVLIGVAVAGLRTRRLDAVDIFLGVAELERIFRRGGGEEDFVQAAVEELGEALLRADAVVMVAARADAEITIGRAHV